MKKFNSIVFLFFIALNVQAQKSSVFVSEGKAIRGYDPVAFFKEAKPLMGADSLSCRWKDADWFFSSRENLENFKADPENYAPQFGGYCAYGTSKGHKAPTKTETWTIVDGKLYFNYDSKVKAMWTKNQKALIEKADEIWVDLKDKE